MSDKPSTPSLTDLLKRAGQAPLERVYVSLPARVESYDATRQCVNAQPWIEIEETGEDGRTVVRRHPVVTNCPVLFPRSGPFAITFPIEVGSTVILHFASASLDRWLTLGGEVEPQDPRRHTLDDAFAVPAGHSFGGETAPATTAPQDAMVLHYAAGKLGGPGATSEIARKVDLSEFMTILGGVTDSAGACAALHAALVAAGWPHCLSTTKAL